MPSSDLAKYIQDLGAGTYRAKYKPAPLSEKPAEGCDIPPFLPGSLTFPVMPVIPVLECNTNFVPFPVVAPPYIPPNLTTPCPDGFVFDARYNSTNGEVLRPGTLIGGTSTVVFAGNGGTKDNLDHKVFNGYDSDATNPLPMLVLQTLIVPTGSTFNGIVLGGKYKVKIVDYDISRKDWGVAHNSVTYHHNQIFTGSGVTTTASASPPDQVANITLYAIEERRVTSYDPTPENGNINIESAFTTSTGDINLFNFKRIVVGFDPLKESGGDIRFLNEGCGGKLIGDINLNIDDLNIPCKNGFSFDAGYNPILNQDIVVTQVTVTPTVTDTSIGFSFTPHVPITFTAAVNRGTVVVDFLSLIPTDIPLSLYPNLIAYRDTTKYKRKILGAIRVGSTTYLKLSEDAVGLYPKILRTPPGADPEDTPEWDYAHDKWKIERIMTETSLAGSSSEFQFSPVQCGGTLSGLISIDSNDVSVPCAGQITGGSYVGQGTGITITNNIYNDTTGAGTGAAAPTIGIVKSGTPCANVFSLNGTNLSLPDIGIEMEGADVSKRYEGGKIIFKISPKAGTGGTVIENNTACFWA